MDSEYGIMYREDNNNSIVIVGCDTERKTLTVPDYFGEKRVNSVVPYAFADSKAENISLPFSISSLSDHAFYHAKNLKTVSYSPSVTYIPTSCFEGCESLTDLPITSLTSISSSAFRDCKSLNITHFPAVTYISDYSFAGCESLTSFVLPSDMSYIPYHCFDGCTSLTDIPSNNRVTYISDYAFRGCTGLTHVELPYLVNSLYDGAFMDCTNLVSISLPEHMTYLDDYVFMNCESLEEINIPLGVTSIYTRAFYGCKSLKTVTLPESVTYVSSMCFADCTALESVNILTHSSFSISDNVFLNCPNLKEISSESSYLSYSTCSFGLQCDENGIYSASEQPVTINCGPVFYAESYHSSYPLANFRYVPRGLRYHVNEAKNGIIIDEIQVDGEAEYMTIIIPQYLEELPVVQLGNGTTCVKATGDIRSLNVSCPETLQLIADYAFLGCKCLTNLYTNTSLQSIGRQALYGTQLEANAKTSNGTLILGNTILYRCYVTADTYELPETIKIIAADAFRGNNTLKTVILNDALERIEDGAFYDCSALTTIQIPDSVTYIGDTAFAFDSSLNAVTLGSGIEQFGGNIFYQCNALKDIEAKEGSTAAEWLKKNFS